MHPQHSYPLSVSILSPTHPALLDWLAVEFVEREWSVKELHRLIVMSATYRQSSRVSEPLLEFDSSYFLFEEFSLVWVLVDFAFIELLLLVSNFIGKGF